MKAPKFAGRKFIFRRRKVEASTTTTGTSSPGPGDQLAIKLTDSSITEKSSFDVSDNMSEVSWDAQDDATSSESLALSSSWEILAVREVEFWEKVLKDRLQRRGLSSFETAEAYSNLGVAQMNSTLFVNACTSFTKATEIFGESHLGVAKNYNLLGLAASQANRLDLAMEALVSSLTVRSKILGSCHVDTVDTFNNIGAVYSKQKDYLEASRVFEEVLILRQAIFGRNHPSVAVTARTLARLYVRLLRKEEAEPLYALALSTCRLERRMKRMKSDIEQEMKRLGVEEQHVVEL